jgi:calcineurin-like phosphoesterase family protein
MATWWTADSHFFHNNIIKYTARPFTDLASMNAAMVTAWNAVVQPGDDVWHLGDFALGDPEAAAGLLKRLKGRKHLVWGNHDLQAIRTLPGWASSQQMAETTVDGTMVVMLHYKMAVWPRKHYGAIHVYGHSHGVIPADGSSCDVGVDAWGFAPVRLSDIRQRMAESEVQS